MPKHPKPTQTRPRAGDPAPPAAAEVVTEPAVDHRMFKFHQDLFMGGPTILFRWRAAEGWPVEYVSPNISQFGYRPEDLVSGAIPYSRIVHPDDLNRVAAEVRDYSAAGAKCFEQEYRVVCADGRVRWVYDYTAVVRDAGQQITHYHGYVLDTTARKTAETAMRESWAKYEAAINAFDGIVYICSQDYIVEFANKRLQERTGFDPVGHKCYKVLHSRSDICPWCVNDAVMGGKTVRWEIQSPKDNRWYYVINTPILHADGRRSKMAMIQDITDRRRNEENINRRDAILQAIGFAAERLMRAPVAGPLVAEVLARLGQATKVSRIGLFEARKTPDGDIAASRRHEWCAPGVPPQIYNPDLQELRLTRRGLARWAERLARGQNIEGLVRELPGAERELLEAQGLRAILVVPIFAGADWWGFLSFEQAGAEREWTPTEVDILRVAAGILGSAFQRARSEQEINRLILAINQTADSIYIANRDGVIEYANAAFEKMTGYTAVEIVGRRPEELDAAAHDREFYESIWRNAAAGRVQELETQHARKDGSLFFAADIITAVRDAQGQITHFVTASRDITGQKQAAEDLRKSREMLQLVMDCIPQFIFWKDTHSVFLGCNRNFARAAGVGLPENIVGKTDYDMPWSREQAEFFRGWDRQVMQSNQPAYHIIEAQTQTDGREAWLDTTKVPLHDAAGEVVGILGMYEDITERRKAEELVRRLAAFPQFNPNPILEFREDGGVIYVNQAAQNAVTAFGKTQVADLLPADIGEIVRNCLASGASTRGLEVRVGSHTLNWSLFPVMSSRTVHAYGQDVTERLNLELQLRQLQKMDAVGRLAGGVAHDFNNILTAILGYVNVLLLDKTLAPAAIEQLQEIARAADRAGGLTRQLLTFSRRQVLQPKLLNLNEVINNMNQMLRRIIGEDIELDLRFAAELPPVHADEVMMEQVILNLAVNARDAMPGGGQLIIATDATELTAADARKNPESRPGRFVCLTVTDTGCGMDENIRASIFEPFFSTKESGKGTGLGLATVYGIVKQHEGWIVASSAVGKGSQFRIFLPAHTAVPAGGEARRPAGKVRGGTETVLIAEDEPAVRKLVHSTLTRFGYQVLEAASGAEGLRVWDQSAGQVDLLVTDMVMPGGMSGRDLADQLLSRKPGLRVLFISGYNLDMGGADFAPHKGYKFLPKPFTPDTLAQAVRNCLDE